VDNSVSLCGCATPPASLFKELDKSFSAREAPVEDLVVAALVVGQDLLAARLEALELQVAELLALIEEPLPPEVLIHKIQQLRERIA
jgi:hypothetical protein